MIAPQISALPQIKAIRLEGKTRSAGQRMKFNIVPVSRIEVSDRKGNATSRMTSEDAPKHAPIARPFIDFANTVDSVGENFFQEVPSSGCGEAQNPLRSYPQSIQCPWIALIHLRAGPRTNVQRGKDTQQQTHGPSAATHACVGVRFENRSRRARRFSLGIQRLKGTRHLWAEGSVLTKLERSHPERSGLDWGIDSGSKAYHV